jgi:hypothetical protein
LIVQAEVLSPGTHRDSGNDRFVANNLQHMPPEGWALQMAICGSPCSE